MLVVYIAMCIPPSRKTVIVRFGHINLHVQNAGHSCQIKEVTVKKKPVNAVITVASAPRAAIQLDKNQLEDPWQREISYLALHGLK